MLGESSWKFVQPDVNGHRWEEGKQSAIIYSWLFTFDRVTQAEGLITWRDLRWTVTDHSQSHLLCRFFILVSFWQDKKEQ